MGYRAMFWMAGCTLLTLISLAGTARALTESELAGTGWETTLEPFFRSGIRFDFQGADGLPLTGVRFPNESATDTIVFLPGFSEPWLKYIELLHELHRNGFEVLSYDHRGQGTSPRLARSNPDAVHLVRFEDHRSDLKQFLESVASKRKIHVLAHSMGGAVALDLIENPPSSLFSAQIGHLVLNAPMLAIRTEPFPRPLARVITSFLVTIGLGERYAPTKGPRDPGRPFEANRGTSSPVRYAFEQKLAGWFPERWVGGPTNSWVKAALEASSRIAGDFSRISRPVAMLVPTEDHYADPEELVRICETHRSRCSSFTMEGSRHEIFAETDSHRNRAIQTVLRTLKNPLQNPVHQRK